MPCAACWRMPNAAVQTLAARTGRNKSVPIGPHEGGERLNATTAWLFGNAEYLDHDVSVERQNRQNSRFGRAGQPVRKRYWY
jgi:hypothetical protein